MSKVLSGALSSDGGQTHCHRHSLTAQSRQEPRRVIGTLWSGDGRASTAQFLLEVTSGRQGSPTWSQPSSKPGGARGPPRCPVHPPCVWGLSFPGKQRFLPPHVTAPARQPWGFPEVPLAPRPPGENPGDTPRAGPCLGHLAGLAPWVLWGRIAPPDGVSSSRQRWLSLSRQLCVEPCSCPALDTARRESGASDGGGRGGGLHGCATRGGFGEPEKGRPRACACVCMRVRAHAHVHSVRARICAGVSVSVRACIHVPVCKHVSGRVCLRAPACATCIHVCSCETCARALATACGRTAQRSGESRGRRVADAAGRRPRIAPEASSAGRAPRARSGLLGGSELPVTVCARRLGSREGGA